MSNLNVGLYLSYETQSGSDYRFRVSDFCFDGGVWVRAHDKIAPAGRVYLLKCACGSNDWTDNGRSINEYECNCCGEFVTATEFRN